MLRIGIIGVGNRGTIADIWNQPGRRSKITAVADIDDVALKNFKKLVDSNTFVTNDYKKLLARNDVDAVVISTPDNLHKCQAIETLSAGKHLFIDKPMAISIDECDEILAKQKETGLKLMIGHNMRYMPMYQQIKEIIDEGTIGNIKSIWVRHFVGRGGEYYYQDWHRNSLYTNSLLLQKGSHDIDIIHMLGKSYTKKVSAFGSLDFYNNRTYFKSDGLKNKIRERIDVEDNNVLIMELENGIKASYLQCHFTPDYSRSYLVIGTKGSIENNDDNQTITVKMRNSNHIQQKNNKLIEIKGASKLHEGADVLISRAFVNYVTNDIVPQVSAEDGRMSVAVGAKATESLREGGGLKIIPPINM